MLGGVGLVMKIDTGVELIGACEARVDGTEET